MRSLKSRAAAVAGALGLLQAAPAAAHHAMDGKLPSTFLEGLLSGLAHPVIGPDHLAFIAAIGIAAALVPAGFGLIAAFLAASTAGVLLHSGSLSLPMGETLVAGSVVVAGLFVALGRRTSGPLWLALALLAGVVHGYAFGEAIVGADRPVLGAYLVGLTLITALVASAIMALARTYLVAGPRLETYLRRAGAGLGCVGLVMLAAGLAG